MATIIKLSYKKTTKPYSKYDEITQYHCWKLLEFLYDDKKLTWTNPITKKELNRNSDIIISFLSKCYYVWGDLDIIFNGEKLTYKKHIERFIDKEYLFDIRKLKISSAIVANKPKSKLENSSQFLTSPFCLISE